MSHYLYRESYLDEDDISIVVRKHGKIVSLRNPYEMREEVIQWRKTYQIHEWFKVYYSFESNEPIDDDARVYVDVKDMKMLLGCINRVLKDHTLAHSLLPYSSEDIVFWERELKVKKIYGDYYFEQLVDTKMQLEQVIEEDKLHLLGPCRYYYEVSY